MDQEINFENYKEVYGKVKIISEKYEDMRLLKAREFKKTHNVFKEKVTSGSFIFLFYIE